MNLISQYRRKAKVSQAVLAAKAGGWKATRIGNYESGYREAGIEEGRAIARAISELLGETVTLDDIFPPAVDQEQAA